MMLPLVGAHAQGDDHENPPAVTPAGRPTIKCGGQPITAIRIQSTAPSVANLQRFPVIAGTARALHSTTRPEVIDRLLLLGVGDRCEERRRAESERLLRAQPFLADADVFVVPDEAGGVELEVHTVDEGSMVLGGSVRGRSPVVTQLLVGNANIGGEGIYAAFSWRSGEGFRDAITGRVVDRQFLGRPMTLTVEANREPIGGAWRLETARPFYTDLQRVGWRVQSGGAQDYIELRLPSGERPAVRRGRGFWDAGAVGRVGPPGRFTLFGASLTSTDEETGYQLIVNDRGEERSLAALTRIYSPRRVARANLLIGLRDLEFVRMVGVDALSGTQDVPVGVQVGVVAGRTVRALGSRDTDRFLAGDLYAGAVTPAGISRLQARGEGWRDTTNRWHGVLGSARATHVVQESATVVNTIGAEWSGTFAQTVPFQLLLGAPDGGVRGYEESSLAGGQRVVVRGERRVRLGQVLRLADAGVAAFVDAGRQWAGSVPYGRTTSWRGAVGVSLLGAMPPRSMRLWRMDVAFPLASGDAGGRWTVRFTNLDRAGLSFREPRDVRDAREPTVPSSIFSWP